MAVLLGLFDSDNYNWRSMTSPGITGLFNPNCLQSGAENLMKCYPGDNTYSGAPLTAVSLVNPDNQFHSVTTTVGVNGKDLPVSWINLILLSHAHALCMWYWGSFLAIRSATIIQKVSIEPRASGLLPSTYDRQRRARVVFIRLTTAALMHLALCSGYAGAQIVPRFATNVYYNCVTGQVRNICRERPRHPFVVLRHRN